MPRGKKAEPNQILSVSEMNNLKEEKMGLEQTIKDIEEVPGSERASSINQERINQNIRVLDKQIHQGKAPTISGYGKDKAATRVKELATQITVGMPTYDQMHNPRKYPGIIRKNVNWSKSNASRIAEYKQLVRTLEPGDPSAPSVENLRKLK